MRRYLFIVVSVACTILPWQVSRGQVKEQSAIIDSLLKEAEWNLTESIFPYWSGRMVDWVNGGFVGRIDGKDQVYPDSEKGGILNARILWTWSAAYRIMRDTTYLRLAERARDYIYKFFLDERYGGAYRSVTSKGEPADTRKQTYTLSFFIYALAEYSRATGDKAALEKAVAIYNCIEKYASDYAGGGYFEVFTRDWQRSHDLLIGEKSIKEEKTMNTHLHLLESYTNLYRIWPDTKLRERLLNIVSLFENRIIDRKTFHLIPFLDRNWVPASASFSYGHDIECSWLLYETSVVLGDQALKGSIRSLSLKIADAAAEGLQPNGAMATEKDLKTGRTTSERSWWEQSETVVGYLNAWELTGNPGYLSYSEKCMNYINGHFVDRKNGGWFSTVDESGNPVMNDKAGFWICPYHSGRMCLEIIERLKNQNAP